MLEKNEVTRVATVWMDAQSEEAKLDIVQKQGSSIQFVTDPSIGVKAISHPQIDKPHKRKEECPSMEQSIPNVLGELYLRGHQRLNEVAFKNQIPHP